VGDEKVIRILVRLVFKVFGNKQKRMVHDKYGTELGITYQPVVRPSEIFYLFLTYYIELKSLVFSLTITDKNNVVYKIRRKKNFNFEMR
jgi:hypothetical protein